MHTTPSPFLTFEAVNQIGIVRIANGSQNKIPQAEYLSLPRFQTWITKQELKGLIITGQGRHFSAGADLEYLQALKNEPERLREDLRKGREILDFIEELPLITLAMINGICFGAGLEIALACQYRFCTENAVLALPESTLGLIPGFNGTYRLPRLIGYRKALELIVSGRTTNAEEAFAMGLVDCIVAKNEALPSAVQFVAELTEHKSHQQLACLISAVNNALNSNSELAKERETELFVELVANLK